jgi:hypothetical protein
MQEKTDVSGNNIQVDKIMSEIALRANQLKLTDPFSDLYSNMYRMNMRNISFFIRFHQQFLRYEVYMKTVGAFVLYQKSRTSDYRCVHLSRYLPMPNDQFIESLFKDVLNREVDHLTYENMMRALESSPDSKIDIGYDLNLSVEASLVKGYIRGVYVKKLLLDTNRSFIRWSRKPVTLVLRIKNRLRKMIRRDQ